MLIGVRVISRRDRAPAADVLLGMRCGVRAAQQAPVRGFVRVEHFLPYRREGRDLVAKSAVAAIAASASAAISAGRTVTRPDAGQIVLIVCFVIVGRIMRGDPAAAARSPAALSNNS